MTKAYGRVLLLLAVILGLFALFVAVTGGIDARIAGVPIRSRSWERPAGMAAMLGIGGSLGFRREIVAFVTSLVRLVVAAATRGAHALPIAAMCWAGLAATVFGTFAAGGSDSYGYVSQAERLAEGHLTDRVRADPAFVWPDVRRTLTPLAHTEGRTRNTIAPVYPPGLPLLMAPFALIQPVAVFLVVPLCAVAAVFFCRRLGLEMGEPAAGALAAALLSVSPTFLYQAVQPMSDVPVTAFWLAALVVARQPASWSPPAAGALASLAILIRPNLAPLVLFVIAAAATIGERLDRRRALMCAAAVVPGVAALGAIQQVRYGSPLASGYGPFHELFSADNIMPNLSRYPRWLTDTHTVFIWLWLLAPLGFGDAARPSRAFRWICWAFGIAVFLAYLPYVSFRREEWSYTRFLLPAIPLMLLFAAAVLIRLAKQLLPRAGATVAAALLLGLVAFYAVTSESLGAFGLRRAEQKYPAAGAFVRDRLPERSYVFAMQHSGSIRYYAGRQTIRWDLLDREWLDRAVSAMQAAGYEPYAVLDIDEVEAFRNRFRADSPRAVERMVPVATIGPTRVFAFR
jgi:hypothetical protein